MIPISLFWNIKNSCNYNPKTNQFLNPRRKLNAVGKCYVVVFSVAAAVEKKKKIANMKSEVLKKEKQYFNHQINKIEIKIITNRMALKMVNKSLL